MCLIAQTDSIAYSYCGTAGLFPRSPCLGRDVQKPLKILVVDDQEFVRRSLHSVLAEQAHWQIYEAENGKVALERIRAIEPDVVVLDIVMPEMSGIEAAYEVSQHTLQTKVILISSHYTPEEAAILGRLFSDSTFIQKSEAGKELVPAITRLLPIKRRTLAAKA
jgi:DNA-binding NarL/FixJ family response regulator